MIPAADLEFVILTASAFVIHGTTEPPTAAHADRIDSITQLALVCGFLQYSLYYLQALDCTSSETCNGQGTCDSEGQVSV